MSFLRLQRYVWKKCVQMCDQKWIFAANKFSVSFICLATKNLTEIAFKIIVTIASLKSFRSTVIEVLTEVGIVIEIAIEVESQIKLQSELRFQENSISERIETKFHKQNIVVTVLQNHKQSCKWIP